MDYKNERSFLFCFLGWLVVLLVILFAIFINLSLFFILFFYYEQKHEIIFGRAYFEMISNNGTKKSKPVTLKLSINYFL